jgi:hypothetical protein
MVLCRLVHAESCHLILFSLDNLLLEFGPCGPLVNSKPCTIIVSYCQDKERLPCLNMGVSYHSKIDACERKRDCRYMHAQPAFSCKLSVTCEVRDAYVYNWLL